MCDSCMKHGSGGKWYLNAQSYSEEVARKYNIREYLMEQYRNFEQIPVRRVAGFSPTNLGYALQMPIIGRIVRRFAERMLHSTRPPRNPFRPEGHIGQVVPLEDAVAILETCAAEPLIEKNCMCRYMARGYKEACCINFGVMSQIISQLPRFIPEKEKFQLSRAEAVKRFTEHNRKGYVGTIWYGPYPYIDNLCSCASPECAGIRPRMDFGVMSVHKAEYVAVIDPSLCAGCLKCPGSCMFKAIHFEGRSGTVRVDQERCFGCGVCRHVCPTNALSLVPRSQVPAQAGRY